MDTISDDRIVTIAHYDLAPMAHIDCGRLEAAGIAAMVAGDNQPGLFLIHAVVGRSVMLQVFERDAEEALSILRGISFAPSARPAKKSVAACAHCGAPFPPPRAWWNPLALLLSFLMLVYAMLVLSFGWLIPLLIINHHEARHRNRRCKQCGRVTEIDAASGLVPGTRVQFGRGPVY